MTALGSRGHRAPLGRAVIDVARMLALVPWLIERPGVSVAETSAAFGTTEATIRSDLHHLDFCGLPGLGGGDLFQVDLVADRVVVSMADELRRPLRPTASEALRLVLTADGVAEVLGDEVPALRSAVAKVRDALGVPGQVADVLPDEPLAVTAKLRDAVRDAKRITFEYRGRADEQPRPRQVEPWQMHVINGIWYLQGLDRPTGAGRVFRVDRMFDVEVLSADRDHPVPSQLPEPRYQAAPDAVRVELDVRPQGTWILEAIDAEEVRAVDDEVMRAVVLTDAPNWLADLVMSALGSVAVVEPSSLREEVLRRALEAKASLEGRAGPMGSPA